MWNYKTLLHFIDLASEWVGKVVSFVIILLIVVVIWDVVLRYVYYSRPMWGLGAYGNLVVVYVIFGTAYTLLIRGHVNMDILSRRLSLRVRAIIDLITSSLFFLFCGVLLWFAVPEAVEMAPKLQLSLKLFSPAGWPIRVLAPFAFLLFLLQGLAKFIRDLIIATTGKEAA